MTGLKKMKDDCTGRSKKLRSFYLSLIFCMLLACFFSVHAMERVQAVFVADGDTLRLEDGRWVRLLGLDAPEIGRKGKKGSCAGETSRKALEAYVTNRTIYLKSQGEDRYGRTLGLLLMEGGPSINEGMIRAGMAWILTYDGKPTDLHPWLGIQKEAILKERGVWKKIRKQRMSVAGNRRSGRFHHSDCALARKISPKNRMAFSSPREAFMAGYAPARECIPDPVCP